MVKYDICTRRTETKRDLEGFGTVSSGTPQCMSRQTILFSAPTTACIWGIMKQTSTKDNIDLLHVGTKYNIVALPANQI